MTNIELKEWRAERELTQAGLGKLLGCAMITVQGWENGYNPVPAWLENALIGVDQKLKAQEQ